MKRWTITCKFGDSEAPFHFYVGAPRKIGHPLQNQATWLSIERNGIIPAKVMENFSHVHQIALKNNIDYEDLCVYWLSVEGADLKQKMDEEAGKKSVEDMYKGAARRPYITSCEWPSRAKGQQPAGDSLWKKTPELTARHTMQVAETLWPGSHELSCSARNLFLALALYLGVAPNKEVTLSEIFRTITSDDPTYSICVVMDTYGACLSPLCYGLFNLWQSYDQSFRNQVLLLMTSRLIEFAMATPKKTDPYRDMRTNLQKSFFKV